MNRKIAVVVIIVVALVILLFPIRLQKRDGGSVEYKAITYSITKYHKITSLETDEHFYFDGWRIELFGITLRDDIDDYWKLIMGDNYEA